jgi:hypothetical protein
MRRDCAESEQKVQERVEKQNKPLESVQRLVNSLAVMNLWPIWSHDSAIGNGQPHEDFIDVSWAR